MALDMHRRHATDCNLGEAPSGPRRIIRTEASADLRAAVHSTIAHIMAIALRSRGANLGDRKACLDVVERAGFGASSITTLLDRARRDALHLTDSEIALVVF